MCGTVDCGVELNRANQCDSASCFEVALNRSKKMVNVDADIHKDIECLDLGDINRNQTGVGIVNQHIAAESTGSVVIDTAGTVCHIAHDGCGGTRTELCNNVADSSGEKKQTFWKLQSDLLCTRRSHTMDGLV